MAAALPGHPPRSRVRPLPDAPALRLDAQQSAGRADGRRRRPEPRTLRRHAEPGPHPGRDGPHPRGPGLSPPGGSGGPRRGGTDSRGRRAPPCQTGRVNELSPCLRAVLLGASNLKASLPLVVDLLRRRAGGPVEVLAACGHGRSYIAWSRFLAIRHLPGIAGCGLWQALEDRPGLSTVALLTDAGNDLVYGAPVPAIVRGIEACLEKLA